LQGQDKQKAINERVTQLSITADNHVELAWAQGEGQTQDSDNLQNVVRLSRGFGSLDGKPPPLAATASKTKNGRGEFKMCLRVDMARQDSDPALKLVMCFQSQADRSLWLDAFLWADSRGSICRKHDELKAADQEAQTKAVEAVRAALDSGLDGRDGAASMNEARAHGSSDGVTGTHASLDLTGLVRPDKKSLILPSLSDAERAVERVLPVDVWAEPVSQPCLDKMVSLAHSCIRRTLGYISETEGLFPVLECAVSPSLDAVWLSSADFASISMHTRSRWVLSVAQAVAFLHASRVTHEPFELHKSIAVFSDSNCKLTVVPCDGSLSAELDRQFIVSFAVNVVMSHPDRASALVSFSRSGSIGPESASNDSCIRMLRDALSFSGRTVGGMPVSSYNSEFDVILNEALNSQADVSEIVESWMRICMEFSRDQPDVPLLDHEASLFSWQEYLLLQKQSQFSIEAQDLYERRATTRDPRHHIISLLYVDPDDNTPIFNQFSDPQSPVASKREALVMLSGFIQSIPENRSRYLEAGFLDHMLLLMSKNSSRRSQADDHMQEFCLNILSHILGLPIFLTFSWASVDEQKRAEDVCKLVCEVLFDAVALEVQHSALICLQKFSLCRKYHPFIFASALRDQFLVLCLKCTTPHLKPMHKPLSLHVSQLSSQILMNLYLGDYAADIRERKVPISEPGCFVPRSIFEIFDILFKRLIEDPGDHPMSSLDRLDCLFETVLKFCAILAIEPQNHPKFWNIHNPLAVTIAMNVKWFPPQALLHVANMLKFVTTSIDTDSKQKYWGHFQGNEHAIPNCTRFMMVCMDQLIGSVPSSCVVLDEALFCALMQFCRMADFVEHFITLSNDTLTLPKLINAARASSMCAISSFLSATINIIIWDEDCTITPAFLKAGLLSLPVFSPNLSVVSKDPSLCTKVAKCILKILVKENDLLMEMFLKSNCIDTLVAFISNMDLCYEDARMQRAALTVCSCFKFLSKNPVACMRLVTIGNGGCLPLVIEYFVPNSTEETRIESLRAICKILKKCRAMIENDKVLLGRVSKYLCLSQGILGILLAFFPKPELSRTTSGNNLQQKKIFQCLANLCALTSSNHEIILQFILDNPEYRAHFLESFCSFQADDACRIPALQFVAELARLGNDISTAQRVVHPEVLRFSVDLFEHVPFQTCVALEINRNDVNSDVVLLFVRIILLFTSTSEISDSVRRVFWPVIVTILDRVKDDIVRITKRMHATTCLLNVVNKSSLENEEQLILICVYALLNMSAHISKSSHTQGFGKDVLPLLVPLFQEPSPCRIVALEVVSILAAELGQDLEFMRAIVELPSLQNSVLSTVAQVVFRDVSRLAHEERLKCIVFFATCCSSYHEASGVLHDILMHETEDDNFESLLLSLSRSMPPEHVLDTLSTIHLAVKYKIEQGLIVDVNAAYFNSKLIQAVAQLVLPLESPFSLTAVEVLSDIMDPQPFELQSENYDSAAVLAHLWPHFVSIVSTDARASPEKLVRAVSKILASRISICDAKILGCFDSAPFWSMNAIEIFAVVDAPIYCVQQKCIIVCSLRRFITASVYKNASADAVADVSVKEADDTMSSIINEQTVSFLIETVNSVLQAKKSSSNSVSTSLQYYLAEHAAFVLMHISAHLSRTGGIFQRSCVQIFVALFMSCLDSPPVTNFEFYILACLYYVVLSPEKAKMVMAADFEKPAVWERVINRMNVFDNISISNGNEVLLIPGMSHSQICLGLFDGMCDCSVSNANFLQTYVRIPFGVISPYVRSEVTAERHHAMSILCKLAQMSHGVPEIMLDFWRHASAAEFVRSIHEIMDTGDTVADREPSCAFMYFSTKPVKERSDAANEIFEKVCQITFGYNSPSDVVLPHENITSCVFCNHPILQITSLHCLRNFSLIFLRPTLHYTYMLIAAFQQNVGLFYGLAEICSIEVVDDRLSCESSVPILREEFKALGLGYGQFRRHFTQSILEFFFNTSSIADLVQCFAGETIIQCIVQKLSSPKHHVSAMNPSDWQKQSTSSGSPFWKHKETGETRWESPHIGSDIPETAQQAQDIDPSLDGKTAEGGFQLDCRMLAVNTILNLCKFGGANMLAGFEKAGIVPLLIGILKDETAHVDFASRCLIVLGKVARSQHAKDLMESDFEFLSRIYSFLKFSGGFKRLGNTLHLLVLLREITQVPSICDFFVSVSSGVEIFHSILEIFERDFEETKLQALAVLSNLVANDRVKAEIPKSNFVSLIVEIIKRPPAQAHLQLSLSSLLNVISNSPSNQTLVASITGLIEELCKYYLDPTVGSDDDAIKNLVSELLIVLSNSPSSISGGLYQRSLSTRSEPFIRLLCRIVRFQASNNGPSKSASLGLLYTTSITSTNVSVISEFMIDECRTQPQDEPRSRSTFENLVMFLASTSSSEREIAANIISGVAKVSEWAVFFAHYRPQIQVSDASALILPAENLALIPALLHSAAQSQFPRESCGAASALAFLSDHEEHLCEILTHEPTFDRLLSVLGSDNTEASVKTSMIFCNVGACSKTQASIGRNEALVQSLSDNLPQNATSDDPRVRNIINCFHHISKSGDSQQLSALSQNRVLLQIVRQFGCNSSLHICEILLNICHAFSPNPDVLDRVVRAGTVSTLITVLVSKNFDSRVVASCFQLLNQLKTVPGVLLQYFDHIDFIEMVCTSIYPKYDLLEAALLLHDLSAVKEQRQRMFSCIIFVKDACKFLLRSNRQPLHGVALTAQEICIGANILSNLAEDYCHLDDFSSFFNYFPEHMWYRQMNTDMSQAPNSQVQECCSRAIYTLCEGEAECFQINQMACAHSCLSQLYGLLEYGASDLARINSAHALCAITALSLSHKQEIRALLTSKISAAQLWRVPLLVIRQRDPADAVRFCLGLISHLVEDAGRGSELAMVPVENIGGVTKHIEWYAMLRVFPESCLFKFCAGPFSRA